ncbi:hypothetical protein QAD02_008077 [Eretmocerus hayati]|uniref:Uncharacterized protein n=1 Tax=Eretmocerus hayati TaxID=131215 RepID=A0ACC2N5E6_9HYME|nr:hypothetical protein QAD02_008077 [Eretmocerus hayati]
MDDRGPIHPERLREAKENERQRLLGLDNAAGDDQILQNEVRFGNGANRIHIDGYGRPARYNQRGRLVREVRSRRQLAITVYDLYHRPGGLHYDERANWRYRVVGHRVHLTRNLTADNMRFGIINWSSGKNFIAATASMLFTPQELLDSALDRTQVKNLIPGRAPPHVIDRERLLLLLSWYHDYVFGESSSATLRQREKALLKGCSYLSRSLCDFRKEEIEKLEREHDGVNLDG